MSSDDAAGAPKPGVDVTRVAGVALPPPALLGGSALPERSRCAAGGATGVAGGSDASAALEETFRGSVAAARRWGKGDSAR
jgi:hypothetical protein